MGKFAKTITQPLGLGYFPDQETAEKLVADMRKMIDEEYDHPDLFEFKGISMGYGKCHGYGEHEACDDVVAVYGTLKFGLKDAKDIGTK